MSPGFLGIEWGVHHYRMFPSGDALTMGRFMFSGCIDAPDRIPGGGMRCEWFPEISEHVPSPIEIDREPHLEGGSNG